jgi:hypothetical protein
VDELWQRYRTFWTPVLWGVGVFLAGLIVVTILTDDPSVGILQNDTLYGRVKNKIVPSRAQFGAVTGSAKTYETRVEDFARRLDQRHGETPDLESAAVAQMLRAAITRGSAPADPAAFDGDEAAAAQATERYKQLLADRLQLLKGVDPNVSFSRLQADVVQELSVRANRADVDLGQSAEDFGLSTVASVDRANLPRFLLNLALIATVVDVAIRERARSIDVIAIEQPETAGISQGFEGFLTLWPVQVSLTGSPQALRSILNVLTDPARPTAVGRVTWAQSGKKDGMVKAEMHLYSVRVKADAQLGLENERAGGN